MRKHSQKGLKLISRVLLQLTIPNRPSKLADVESITQFVRPIRVHSATPFLRFRRGPELGLTIGLDGQM